MQRASTKSSSRGRVSHQRKKTPKRAVWIIERGSETERRSKIDEDQMRNLRKIGVPLQAAGQVGEFLTQDPIGKKPGCLCLGITARFIIKGDRRDRFPQGGLARRSLLVRGEGAHKGEIMVSLKSRGSRVLSFWEGAGGEKGHSSLPAVLRGGKLVKRWDRRENSSYSEKKEGTRKWDGWSGGESKRLL